MVRKSCLINIITSFFIFFELIISRLRIFYKISVTTLQCMILMLYNILVTNRIF